MVIQPIVEGKGEVEAVRVLLGRLQESAGVYGFRIARPIRRNRSELSSETPLRRSIRLALGTADCAGILVLFDADDDAACNLGPSAKAWAQAEAGNVRCEVVLATREYEAWFVAAIESLRGFRGIDPAANSHPTPEIVRDAKRALEERMVPGYFYSPTADQPSLTAHFDLGKTHRKCRSFRKMVKAFSVLAESAGSQIANWPPADW